jgi:hypothetical protein
MNYSRTNHFSKVMREDKSEPRLPPTKHRTRNKQHPGQEGQASLYENWMCLKVRLPNILLQNQTLKEAVPYRIRDFVTGKMERDV